MGAMAVQANDLAGFFVAASGPAIFVITGSGTGSWEHHSRRRLAVVAAQAETIGFACPDGGGIIWINQGLRC